jgi:hypothetical protein
MPGLDKNPANFHKFIFGENTGKAGERKIFQELALV